MHSGAYTLLEITPLDQIPIPLKERSIDRIG